MCRGCGDYADGLDRLQGWRIFNRSALLRRPVASKIFSPELNAYGAALQSQESMGMTVSNPCIAITHSRNVKMAKKSDQDPKSSENLVKWL